jgi:DNA-cytosine methyltransferase
MKILSLFDGISATNQALKNIGIENYEYFASEIDLYAIKVTQNNFPNTRQLGDVNGIVIEDGWIFYNQNNDPIKNGGSFEANIDLIIGGSPCQSFSIAGNQKGFKDPRGQLFWKYVRILNEVKPKFFIFENVNSMKQRDKDIISKALGFEPVVLNSALVSAQQRKRLFYVGKLQEDGTYAKVHIPQPKDEGILLKDIVESGVWHKNKSDVITASDSGAVLYNTLQKSQRTMIFEPLCISSRGRHLVDGKRIDIKGAKCKQQLELNITGKTNTLTTVQKDNMVLEPIINPLKNISGKGWHYEQQVYSINSPKARTLKAGGGSGNIPKVLEPLRIWQYNKGGQGDRVYSTDGKSVCLSANGGGRGANTGLYFIPIEVEEIIKTAKVYYIQDDNLFEYKDGELILVYTHKNFQNLAEGFYTVRKLTVKECCRLQTFPDGYFIDEEGNKVISDSQAYKCLGNSFTVRIVEHILKTIWKI